MEKKWASTFDAVSDLIVILDTDRRILRMNPAMAERVGDDKISLGASCYGMIPWNRCPSPCLSESNDAENRAEHLQRNL